MDEVARALKKRPSDIPTIIPLDTTGRGPTKNERTINITVPHAAPAPSTVRSVVGNRVPRCEIRYCRDSKCGVPDRTKTQPTPALEAEHTRRHARSRVQYPCRDGRSSPFSSLPAARVASRLKHTRRTTHHARPRATHSRASTRATSGSRRAHVLMRRRSGLDRLTIAAL